MANTRACLPGGGRRLRAYPPWSQSVSRTLARAWWYRTAGEEWSLPTRRRCCEQALVWPKPRTPPSRSYSQLQPSDLPWTLVRLYRSWRLRGGRPDRIEGTWNPHGHPSPLRFEQLSAGISLPALLRSRPG